MTVRLTKKQFDALKPADKDWYPISFAPVVDVSGGAFASGDVLFNPTEIPNAFPPSGKMKLIQTTAWDYADQGFGITLDFFAGGHAVVGTVNAAISAADDALRGLKYIGTQPIANTDQRDYINSRGITVPSELYLTAAGTSRSLFVVGIAGGAGTYLARSWEFGFIFVPGG
jgi:hypothetical protein